MLVPVWPVKLMTSPGLMDLSISSTNPLTKLLAMACRPKPSPKPMAPVSTFSVVTSTPAALIPSMIPRPTSRKYVNFETPMRVETASCSMRMTRRSKARAIRLLMITKAVTMTSPFNRAHRLNCVLPGIRLMRLSVLSMVSSQPTSENDIISHSTKVMRFSHPRIQDSGPSIRRSR